jgi:hypothetical protein
MAEDWFADVQKYEPGANPDHVAGIVRYCGIALRRPDSALVAFSSPEETARVRENFLRKKLALGDPDSVLDEAIAAVGERMKADRTKNRVTVYYLLADRFGRLGDFLKAPKGGSGSSAASAPASAPTASVSETFAAPCGARAEPELPGSEPPAAPSHAAATPPTEFGRREPATFGTRGTSESASTSEPAPPRFADTAPSPAEPAATGSRWWLWLLLLIVVLIILFVILR